MTASAWRTQPGGGEGAGGGQRGHERKFPEVAGLFRSPARDPAGSQRPPGLGEVGVGVLREGGAPKPRAGFSSFSLLAPRLPGAPPGSELDSRREGRGRQRCPSQAHTSPGRGPRGQSPGTKPRGPRPPPRIIKPCGGPPTQGWSSCGGCWSGLCWPFIGSARPEPKVRRATPTWG